MGWGRERGEDGQIGKRNWVVKHKTYTLPCRLQCEQQRIYDKYQRKKRMGEGEGEEERERGKEIENESMLPCRLQCEQQRIYDKYQREKSSERDGGGRGERKRGKEGKRLKTKLGW